jgi:hypothetical protein
LNIEVIDSQQNLKKFSTAAIDQRIAVHLYLNVFLFNSFVNIDFSCGSEYKERKNRIVYKSLEAVLI